MTILFVPSRDTASQYKTAVWDAAVIRPIASNIATAEMLVLGMARGDLDWRNIVNPKNKFKRDGLPR